MIWITGSCYANGHDLIEQELNPSSMKFVRVVPHMADWAEQVRAARNQYAQANHMPARDDKLDWKDTKTLPARERVGEEED